MGGRAGKSSRKERGGEIVKRGGTRFMPEKEVNF